MVADEQHKFLYEDQTPPDNIHTGATIDPYNHNKSDLMLIKSNNKFDRNRTARVASMECPQVP